MNTTLEGAIKALDMLCQTIDNDMPVLVMEKDKDFLEDVYNKAVDMSEKIRQSGHVTPEQLQAIENWKQGIDNLL